VGGPPSVSGTVSSTTIASIVTSPSERPVAGQAWGAVPTTYSRVVSFVRIQSLFDRGARPGASATQGPIHHPLSVTLLPTQAEDPAIAAKDGPWLTVSGCGAASGGPAPDGRPLPLSPGATPAIRGGETALRDCPEGGGLGRGQPPITAIAMIRVPEHARWLIAALLAVGRLGCRAGVGHGAAPSPSRAGRSPTVS